MTDTTTKLGLCTRDPAHGPAEVPWSGERLCWPCADHDLDLIAKALEDEPVQVGGFGLGNIPPDTMAFGKDDEGFWDGEVDYDGPAEYACTAEHWSGETYLHCNREAGHSEVRHLDGATGQEWSIPSQDELADALALDLVELAGGSVRRAQRIVALLSRPETWEGAAR